ncbi:MAG: peptidoglycan DD-metalloendopeptidase family protein [Clostridia bacterium]|nr:peptidoglycan DD-metalloendopeptidase family protein [Clostridia bacterium]
MRIKLNKMLALSIIFVLLFSWVFEVGFSFASNEPVEEQQQEAEPEEEKTELELQIEDLEVQKGNLENAITSNEAQIGVVEGMLSATLEEIEQLSTKIEQKKKEISNLEVQEISLMRIIETEEKKLEETTQKYEEEKALLEKRLVVMYEMGNLNMLDVLLNSKNLSDFLSRYYLLGEIGQADQKLLNNVKKDKTQTESITKSLNEMKDELEKDKDDKEKYQISLNNMEILKNSKINSLNEEEIKLYQDIETYRQEIQTIESEIKDLALQNLGQKYIGGKFIWPTPGYSLITSPFGLRTHPITGIYKLHTGTDIGAPYGANFIAANDGVVVKAEHNTAYGNMVIINHGGGVMTLYAHGSSIEVKEGDIVKQGQTVLKVGMTGYATGPHAHFEIRINGDYLNPMDYISPDNGEGEHDIESLTVVVNEDD